MNRKRRRRKAKENPPPIDGGCAAGKMTSSGFKALGATITSFHFAQARRKRLRFVPNVARTGAAYPFITAAKGSYKIKAAQGRIGSVFS